MKAVLSFISALLLLSSCEKNIDFQLNQASDLLVVDANIENAKPPVVVLTKSFNIFNEINPAILLSSFVRNATVTISNGTVTHTLKEYADSIGPGIVVYHYGIDSSNLATAFVGTFNTSYHLHIKAGGQDYDASTTIPILAKRPDSLWWKPAPFVTDTTNVVLMVRSTDPPGLGNYVRYFTKRNSGPFLPGENSVFDDQVIDGTTYQIQVDPGIDRNNRVPFDSNYFKRGDTITLKLCNIDRASYQFWSTWEYAFQSIGNPFGQPNKVIGNISNGALGAFYGYASASRTLIIPR